MKKDLAIRALDIAVRLRNPLPGCIFHSDRGSQYCSHDFRKKLETRKNWVISGEAGWLDDVEVAGCTKGIIRTDSHDTRR